MAAAEKTTAVQVNEAPKFVVPAKMYGVNISKEVETALLLLSEVPAVTSELEKIKLDNAVKTAKKTRKVGADLRLDITRQIDAFKTQYTSTEKEYFNALDTATANAEKLINAFNAAELAKARAEQERIRLEGEKEAARKRTATSVANVEMATQAKLEAVALPSGTRMAWAWEIATPEDIKKIPAEFIQEAIIAYLTNKGELPEFLRLALNEFVRAGGRSLAGVKISEQPVRTGR